MQLRNGTFNIVSEYYPHGLGEVHIERYAKHWHLYLLKGINIVDEFRIEGDKHKANHEIRKRGWLASTEYLVPNWLDLQQGQ